MIAFLIALALGPQTEVRNGMVCGEPYAIATGGEVRDCKPVTLDKDKGRKPKKPRKPKHPKTWTEPKTYTV